MSAMHDEQRLYQLAFDLGVSRHVEGFVLRDNDFYEDDPRFEHWKDGWMRSMRMANGRQKGGLK